MKLQKSSEKIAFLISLRAQWLGRKVFLPILGTFSNRSENIVQWEFLGDLPLISNPEDDHSAMCYHILSQELIMASSTYFKKHKEYK